MPWGTIQLSQKTQHRLRTYTYAYCGITIHESFDKPKSTIPKCKKCERIYGLERKSKHSS